MKYRIKSLSSEEGMEEVKRKDGQLISVRVDFNPEDRDDKN